MNFIPEQVHFISTYFSVFVYFNDILLLYKSFQNSFILVFNPSEILVLVLNFILEAWKLKTTSPQIEKRRLHVVLSKWCMCIWSGTKTVYVSENILD